MKISILIPVRNRKESLLTVITQLKRNLRFFKDDLEVIVMDLGSDENISSQLEIFPFVSYCYIDYKGTFCKSWALNLAFKKSRYPWIFALDVDCIFFEKLLSNIATYINAEDKQKCYIFGGIRDLDPSLTKSIQENSVITGKVKSFLEDRYMSITNLLGYGNIILHRDVYEKLTGFDEKMTGWGREDSDFYYRLQFEGIKTITFPDDPHYALYHLDHNRGDVTYNNRLIFYPNDFTESYNKKNRIIQANPIDQWGDENLLPSQYNYESIIDFNVQKLENLDTGKGDPVLYVNGMDFDNYEQPGDWQDLFEGYSSDIDLQKQVIILGGGLNYACKALIEKTQKVIIIEKYRTIRQLACKWNHIDPIYFMDTGYNNLTNLLIKIKEIKPKTILVHKPSLKFDKDWYQTIRDFIQS